MTFERLSSVTTPLLSLSPTPFSFGYQFADKASAEITYEQLDGTDVVNFGLKFAF